MMGKMKVLGNFVGRRRRFEPAVPPKPTPETEEWLKKTAALGLMISRALRGVEVKE